MRFDRKLFIIVYYPIIVFYPINTYIVQIYYIPLLRIMETYIVLVQIPSALALASSQHVFVCKIFYELVADLEPNLHGDNVA